MWVLRLAGRITENPNLYNAAYANIARESNLIPRNDLNYVTHVKVVKIMFLVDSVRPQQVQCRPGQLLPAPAL